MSDDCIFSRRRQGYRRHDLDPPYERSSDAAERVHGVIKEATQSQIWLKASTDKVY
jgi:hypothetical protein